MQACTKCYGDELIRHSNNECNTTGCDIEPIHKNTIVENTTIDG